MPISLVNSHCVDPTTFMRSESISQLDQTATANQREWRERVQTLNIVLSKTLCTDERLVLLDPAAFGLLVRLHAMSRIGRSVPDDVALAARLLKWKPRQLVPALRDLQEIVPDLLNINDGKITVPSIFSKELSCAQMDAARLKGQRAAAARWAKVIKPVQAAPVESIVKRRRSKGNVSLVAVSSVPAEAQTALPEDSLLTDVAKSDDGTSSRGAANCPYQTIADLFNSTCTALSRVNSAKTWAKNRHSVVNNRWKENSDLDFWRNLFDRVQRSDFLAGRSQTWRANFDWILKPSNLQKILEGNYENRGVGRRALWDQGNQAMEMPTIDTAVKSKIDENASFLRPATKTKDDDYLVVKNSSVKSPYIAMPSKAPVPTVKMTQAPLFAARPTAALSTATPSLPVNKAENCDFSLSSDKPAPIVEPRAVLGTVNDNQTTSILEKKPASAPTPVRGLRFRNSNGSKGGI